jgi:hypothetical protein
MILDGDCTDREVFGGLIVTNHDQTEPTQATAARPRWRAPQLKVESVTDMTAIDPVPAPPSDPSIYPGLGFNS